jgi:hypothetical protein
MKREYYLVGIIFLIVLVIRLFFAFQTSYFSSDDSYYTIRQMVHIKETFMPIIYDDLSYGGKFLYLPPFFYYLLAALSFIFKTEFVGKFFPELFASSMVIISYLIACEMSKNKTARIITSSLGGFMPLFFSETLNSISMYSFFIPLTFFNIYCMMRISDNDLRFIPLFILSIILMRMTTPLVVFVLLGFLLYTIFILIEKIPRSKVEIELMIFSTFLIMWTLLVFFKNSFLNYGLALLWQNTPKSVLQQYFANNSIPYMIYNIGIVPFFFGILALYWYLFRHNDKKIYLLMSFLIVMFILIWMHIVDVQLALIFIGFVMVMLFARVYEKIENLIGNKFSNIIFSILIFLLIVITSIIPSLVFASSSISNSFSSQDIEALLWLKRNTNTNDTIAASLYDGHLISGVSVRKNIIDSNFMFVEDVDQRLKDIDIVFLSPSETQRIDILENYDSDYIYLSRQAKNYYKIENIPEIDESECFQKVFSNPAAKIYKSLCHIEES